MNFRPMARPAYRCVPGPMGCHRCADSAEYMNVTARDYRRAATVQDGKTAPGDKRAATALGDKTVQGGRRAATVLGDKTVQGGKLAVTAPGDKRAPGGKLAATVPGGKRVPDATGPGPGFCSCPGLPPSQGLTARLKTRAEFCSFACNSSSFTSGQPFVSTMFQHSNPVRNRKLLCFA